MDFVVSGIEMAQLDHRTISELELPGRVLMEVAGRAVGAACQERLRGSRRVVVACGTGNNGGDGYVAARMLAAFGHTVKVYVFGDRSRIQGEAAGALKTLKRSGDAEIVDAREPKVMWEFAADVAAADLAVDALLGTGIRDEVRGVLGDAIDVLNQESTPVVSVDLPSGIDADTGAVLGRAVDADATVTFAFAKRGHYLFPGADCCGELRVVDIGIPQSYADDLGVVGRLLRPEHAARFLPRRRRSAHKGGFGHVLTLAGSPQTPGAALLAMRGALRSGAGLVTWGANEDTMAHAFNVPHEVMLRPLTSEQAHPALLKGASSIVLGPGLGRSKAAEELVRMVLTEAVMPICVDADALNILSESAELWGVMRASWVLTPHPKEMARLVGSSVEEVQRDRFAAALQLAVHRKCVVVLKGAGTVVADPEGQVTILAGGNPGMAQGGTGDVLAGIIGGMLAQGLDPATAARTGALLHAAAGDAAANRQGQAGMSAGDLIEEIGSVWRQWDR